MSLADNVRWARGIGDFWSYHLLIQGKLEIMIEPVTKLWDIAAMTVIVSEAGGAITQLDGTAIAYDTTTALATNGAIHEEVVKKFA
jgi:histidinol-phosphatase